MNAEENEGCDGQMKKTGIRIGPDVDKSADSFVEWTSKLRGRHK